MVFTPAFIRIFMIAACKVLMVGSFLKLLLFFFVFFCFASAFAQDTVSVYFETGKHKIRESELPRLTTLSSKYELDGLDSMNIIGMTDSVGNLHSNLRLSLKRANSVHKYLGNMLPLHLQVRTLALGEKVSGQKDNSASRRVDIVLYSHRDSIDLAEPLVHKENKAPVTCYEIDYNLLHRCSKRTVIKDNITYIFLEVEGKTPPPAKTHYYATVSKKGKVQVKLLKWQPRKTGRSWWRRTRYFVLIPKADFVRYRIFVKKPAPCSDCSQKLRGNDAIPNETACTETDYFLMSNLQIKKIRKNNSIVKARVPKEYVDPESAYYTYYSEEKELTWKTKSGRKNKLYFFTDLPVVDDRVAKIIKKTECCTYTNNSCCGGDFMRCGGCRWQSVDKVWKLGLEAGNNYYPGRNQVYAGLSVFRSWNKTDLFFLAGCDQYKNLYTSARMDYNFASMPFKKLSPFRLWENPDGAFTYSSYARFYTGTEIRGAFLQKGNSFTGQNIHLGLAWVNAKEKALIPRLFVQAGAGYNYSGLDHGQVYFLLQAGISMKLFRF